MDLTSCKSLSRFGSRELLVAGPDRSAATRLVRHHLSTATRKTSRLTIELCYEILLSLSSFLHHHGCAATLKKQTKTLSLAAVGFPSACVARWRRHHHHRASKSCRRGGDASRASSTLILSVSDATPAPLVKEGMMVCSDDTRWSCDRTGTWQWRDQEQEQGVDWEAQLVQQMMREVFQSALSLGVVVVVEWRHSACVFRLSPSTTTTTTCCREIAPSRSFWDHVSSVVTTTTNANAAILPLLRCEELSICRRGRTLGASRSRDVRVLLEEFEEDFGDSQSYEAEEREDEYAYEIAQYMLELETKSMPILDMSDLPESQIDIRLDGIDELQGIWGHFHTWLGYSFETYWVAHNLFDRYISKRKQNDTLNALTYHGSYLLARAVLYIAAKYMEVLLVDITTFSKAKNTDYIPVDALRKAEAGVLRELNFEVCGGCSPWFWLSRGGRRSSSSLSLKEAVEDFLVHVAMRDWRFCGVRPSMMAAVVVYAVSQMGLTELESEKRRDRVMWSRCGEGEVKRGYEMLVEGLRKQEMSESEWLYRWHKREPRTGASEFALRWAKVNEP